MRLSEQVLEWSRHSRECDVVPREIRFSKEQMLEWIQSLLTREAPDSVWEPLKEDFHRVREGKHALHEYMFDEFRLRVNRRARRVLYRLPELGDFQRYVAGK
jgi:hypothetical protein